MQKGIFTIRSNVPLAPGVYEMALEGGSSAVTAPGQFINIKLEGFYLRRPISVCDWDGGSVTIIYKVLGRGTEYMTTLAPGEKLDILTGLGNGYDLSLCGSRPLLVGGGVGLPPLYGLAKRLCVLGARPAAVLGFNSAEGIFYTDKFAALGVETIVATMDGSAGIRGTVADGIASAGEYTHVYTCGPEPMLKAVYDRTSTDGQFSFEERMGCGFGACMGCSCRTKYGYKRICRDGPVLRREEIVW